MSRWTEEQLQAINLEGTNLLVSAGAGSGKTAVLTERVIRKLRSGININQLLIVTFTKAASGEMKQRIREAILKDPSLTHQLDLIDSAYITTFDSYALSIVRKYHYLINAKKEISIIDENVFEMERTRILDEVMQEQYDKEDPNFMKLIYDLVVKNDDIIKHAILSIDNQLDLLVDKEAYLATYLDNFYLEETIQKQWIRYCEIIQEKLKELKYYGEAVLRYAEEGKFQESFRSMFRVLQGDMSTYDAIYSVLPAITIPRLPNNSSDDLKEAKQCFGNTLDRIKGYLKEKSEQDYIDQVKKTYPYAKILLEMVQTLDQRMIALKHQSDLYSFMDIAKMALQIVRDHDNVRSEIKDGFQEIMVDEYQDTSDIQEEFIRLIAKNNVYMVGDMKQSIYRFRNANPYLFQSKYSDYARGDGEGVKIDLTYNFRSRNAVIEEINTIFNSLMSEAHGGADYKREHQMKAGNHSYDASETLHNHELEVYHYGKFDQERLSNAEYEAFIIANDIKQKLQDHYQVMDKGTGQLRLARYDDFVILMDRGKSFDLYKKIFTDQQIPLKILKEEKMSNDHDLSLIRNLLRLIVMIKRKDENLEFRYAFTSVARSFLGQLSDQEIYDCFKKKDFHHNRIYTICYEIATRVDRLSIFEILQALIDEFHVLELLPRVGDYQTMMVHLEYLHTLANSLASIGYDFFDYVQYLDEVIHQGLEISFVNKSITVSSAVTIMTVHKSKGLEFAICYYSGLNATFNEQDSRADFCFNKELGIVMPYVEHGRHDTFYKTLYGYQSQLENESERIRLLYVALTRSKEKMILLTREEIKESLIPRYGQGENHSFIDFIQTYLMNHPSKIKYLEENSAYTTAYKMGKSKYWNDYIKTGTPLNVQEVHCKKSMVETSSYSKKVGNLISKHQAEELKLGSKIHQVLEYLDFRHPNFLNIDLDEFYLKKIQSFLASPLLESLSEAKLYKEYAFIDQDNHRQGIIDLMVEYKDHIDIIDYKLKAIEEEAYRDQIRGYATYIHAKTNKIVHAYLYSMLDESYVSIETFLPVLQ